MKNKKSVGIVFFLTGFLLLLVGLGMLQNAEKRWIPGIIILISIIILGGASKSITNDIILKKYLDDKRKKNIKVDKVRENKVAHKASSKANLIVSLLLIIVLIIIFLTEINYIVLALIIVISIFMQSSLSAILYIYYNKKIKETNNQ
ncbi:hypothetical protein [Sedimentibacter sp. MB31-C6]|uniref:hypothetical protein n=1 Tax=Sedimentibacter sp. MB31-C6 TaxID=3109366 RepID=UPI002DDDA438|nr:hypothetical protein [Sedimentibacter sp. MB36-C1]WSI04685.1 hypothetical protein U8307_02565 [Sedimentibacter sp. MB36-C1]